MCKQRWAVFDLNDQISPRFHHLPEHFQCPVRAILTTSQPTFLGSSAETQTTFNLLSFWHRHLAVLCAPYKFNLTLPDSLISLMKAQKVRTVVGHMTTRNEIKPGAAFDCSQGLDWSRGLPATPQNPQWFSFFLWWGDSWQFGLTCVLFLSWCRKCFAACVFFFFFSFLF